jgi:hypothetical protein
MTDWWSVQPQNTDGVTITENPPSIPATAPPDPPRREEPDTREDAAEPTAARSKVAKIMGGVAGVVIMGVLAVNGLSGETEVPSTQPGTAATPQDFDRQEVSLPAAGGGPVEAHQEASAPPALKSVTLTSEPAGLGAIGAVMKVAIHNATDRPLTVLASLIEGDGHSAVVGEGTLAPGSRIVQPGSTVEGTVEFSTENVPHQIALLDLSANVVATSTENRGAE